MGLPKQIRNQVKQNEEIEAQLRKEQDEAGTTDTSQAEIDTLLQEVGPQTPPATVTELHPEPEGEEIESPPAAEPKPERTDWKQKYSVLKGKYDAEVPRLSQDLRESQDRIKNLEDKLTGLATQNVVPEPAEQPRTDFTPEEVADYGEDLLEVIGRKARSIVESEYNPTIQNLRTEVATLKSQIGETGQKVGKFEENEVFAQLDREVKDWRKINVDPAFHGWLDQVDPYSGESRKSLLLKAFSHKNAQQVKAFFDGYVKENASVQPNPTDLQPSGQGGIEPGSTLNLGDYIEPGTPRSGGDVGAPKDKRLWSSADISTFYAAVQKGKYRNRLEDKARIEADIVAATREGRIKP
jgi:hypothetical protein